MKSHKYSFRLITVWSITNNVLIQIFWYLDAPSVIEVANICKRFRKIADPLKVCVRQIANTIVQFFQEARKLKTIYLRNLNCDEY